MKIDLFCKEFGLFLKKQKWQKSHDNDAYVDIKQ